MQSIHASVALWLLVLLLLLLTAAMSHLNSDRRSCSFLIAWLRVIYWTAFPAFPRFCFFPMVAAADDCTPQAPALTQTQRKLPNALANPYHN
jgi:hypothetical protein